MRENRGARSISFGHLQRIVSAFRERKDDFPRHSTSSDLLSRVRWWPLEPVNSYRLSDYASHASALHGLQDPSATSTTVSGCLPSPPLFRLLMVACERYHAGWLRVSRRLNAIKTRRHKTRRAHSIDSIVCISFKCVTLAHTSLATRRTTQWIEIAAEAIDLFNLDGLLATDNNRGSYNGSMSASSSNQRASAT